MNNKGQITMQVVIGIFITVLTGVILFQTIAQQVGTSTNTISVANESFTLASEGGSVYLTNYRSISGVVIYNRTGTLVPSANYTVTNDVVYNGALAVKVTTGSINAYANDSANISGTALPLTYISDSGSRSVAALIVIMFALAVLSVTLYPVLKNGMS